MNSNRKLLVALAAVVMLFGVVVRDAVLDSKENRTQGQLRNIYCWARGCQYLPMMGQRGK